MQLDECKILHQSVYDTDHHVFVTRFFNENDDSIFYTTKAMHPSELKLHIETVKDDLLKGLQTPKRTDIRLKKDSVISMEKRCKLFCGSLAN